MSFSGKNSSDQRIYGDDDVNADRDEVIEIESDQKKTSINFENPRSKVLSESQEYNPSAKKSSATKERVSTIKSASKQTSIKVSDSIREKKSKSKSYPKSDITSATKRTKQGSDSKSSGFRSESRKLKSEKSQKMENRDETSDEDDVASTDDLGVLTEHDTEPDTEPDKQPDTESVEEDFVKAEANVKEEAPVPPDRAESKIRNWSRIDEDDVPRRNVADNVSLGVPSVKVEKSNSSVLEDSFFQTYSDSESDSDVTPPSDTVSLNIDTRKEKRPYSTNVSYSKSKSDMERRRISHVPRKSASDHTSHPLKCRNLHLIWTRDHPERTKVYFEKRDSFKAGFHLMTEYRAKKLRKIYADQKERGSPYIDPVIVFYTDHCKVGVIHGVYDIAQPLAEERGQWWRETYDRIPPFVDLKANRRKIQQPKKSHDVDRGFDYDCRWINDHSMMTYDHMKQIDHKRDKMIADYNRKFRRHRPAELRGDIAESQADGIASPTLRLRYEELMRCFFDDPRCPLIKKREKGDIFSWVMKHYHRETMRRKRIEDAAWKRKTTTPLTAAQKRMTMARATYAEMTRSSVSVAGRASRASGGGGRGGGGGKSGGRGKSGGGSRGKDGDGGGGRKRPRKVNINAESGRQFSSNKISRRELKRESRMTVVTFSGKPLEIGYEEEEEVDIKEEASRDSWSVVTSNATKGDDEDLDDDLYDEDFDDFNVHDSIELKRQKLRESTISRRVESAESQEENKSKGEEESVEGTKETLGSTKKSGSTGPSTGIRSSAGVRPSSNAQHSDSIRPSGVQRSYGTRPSTAARPSDGSRPSTGAHSLDDTRLSTVAQPSDSTRPSNVARPSDRTQPSTVARPSGRTQPSTVARTSDVTRLSTVAHPSDGSPHFTGTQPSDSMQQSTGTISLAGAQPSTGKQPSSNIDALDGVQRLSNIQSSSVVQQSTSALQSTEKLSTSAKPTSPRSSATIQQSTNIRYLTGARQSNVASPTTDAQISISTQLTRTRQSTGTQQSTGARPSSSYRLSTGANSDENKSYEIGNDTEEFKNYVAEVKKDGKEVGGELDGVRMPVTDSENDNNNSRSGRHEDRAEPLVLAGRKKVGGDRNYNNIDLGGRVVGKRSTRRVKSSSGNESSRRSEKRRSKGSVANVIRVLAKKQRSKNQERMKPDPRLDQEDKAGRYNNVGADLNKSKRFGVNRATRGFFRTDKDAKKVHEFSRRRNMSRGENQKRKVERNRRREMVRSEVNDDDDDNDDDDETTRTDGSQCEDGKLKIESYKNNSNEKKYVNLNHSDDCPGRNKDVMGGRVDAEIGGVDGARFCRRRRFSRVPSALFGGARLGKDSTRNSYQEPLRRGAEWRRNAETERFLKRYLRSSTLSPPPSPMPPPSPTSSLASSSTYRQRFFRQ